MRGVPANHAAAHQSEYGQLVLGVYAVQILRTLARQKHLRPKLPLRAAD